MKHCMRIVFALALGWAGTAFAAVNVNTAGVDQLETLDGIGTVKAQAIVSDRKSNGRYETLDQLTRVDGIGDKTVAGLRSEATTDSAQKTEDKGAN